jgi:hypothetical protein
VLTALMAIIVTELMVLTLTGLMALMATLWRILGYFLIENAINVTEMKENVAISK